MNLVNGNTLGKLIAGVEKKDVQETDQNTTVKREIRPHSEPDGFHASMPYAKPHRGFNFARLFSQQPKAQISKTLLEQGGQKTQDHGIKEGHPLRGRHRQSAVVEQKADLLKNRQVNDLRHNKSKRAG